MPLLILGVLATSLSCARKGLVSEKYPAEFYRVPKLLPDAGLEKHPTFIVYGDSRPGWRIQEKCLRRENWLTKKMLIFPFYQLYWLGNAVVGGFNWVRHAPDYGAPERRMVRDAIYAQAKRADIDFILHTGDMPGDGRRPSHWETFLQENRVERPLLVDFPYLPVVGNHEKTNDPKYGAPNYRAIFPYPPFYVLDFPDAALFVVDSNLILDQYQFIDDVEQERLFRQWFISGDPARPGWLERELAARDTPFKIVAMHHPPISFGKHHDDWTEKEWGTNLQEKRGQLLKLFLDSGVQVVFCGHEHLYEHNIVRRGADAVHIIISGGGGVPLRAVSDERTLETYQQNYRDEGLDVHAVKQVAVYHYCLVKVDSDQLTINVIPVSEDRAKVEAIAVPRP